MRKAERDLCAKTAGAGISWKPRTQMTPLAWFLIAAGFIFLMILAKDHDE